MDFKEGVVKPALAREFVRMGKVQGGSKSSAAAAGEAISHISKAIEILDREHARSDIAAILDDARERLKALGTPSNTE